MGQYASLQLGVVKVVVVVVMMVCVCVLCVCGGGAQIKLTGHTNVVFC
jgi:hypothetical protein